MRRLAGVHDMTGVLGLARGPMRPRVKSTYSLDFDGLTQHVDLPTGLLQGFTNDFSVSAWFKLSALGHYGAILGDSSTNWFFGVDNANRPYFQSFGGGSVTGGTTLTTGVWYHIAATKSSSSGWVIYLNGVSDGTNGNTSNLGSIAAANAIGASNSGTPTFLFSGKIDDVRLYNAVLSASNVADLPAGQNVTAGLADYWKLDEGTGTTAADSVGSATGTLVDAPAWSTDVPAILA